MLLFHPERIRRHAEDVARLRLHQVPQVAPIQQGSADGHHRLDPRGCPVLRECRPLRGSERRKCRGIHGLAGAPFFEAQPDGTEQDALHFLFIFPAFPHRGDWKQTKEAQTF